MPRSQTALVRLSPVRLSLGGAVALAAAMGIGRFAYTPILPVMVSGLGLNQAEAGMLASVNVFGYLAGALCASLPVLRGSPWGWLLGSLAASAATTLLMGVAESFVALVLLRFLGGFASALVLVFASGVVLDRLAAARRPELASLCFAGVGLGIVLSALLIDLMAGFGVGWRGLWLGVGALAIAATLAVMLLVPGESARTPADAVAERRGTLALGLPLVSLLAAYFLFGLGYVSTATFMVAMVRGAPAMSAVEPIVWLAVGLAACPSLALWTLVSRKVGIVRAFGIALLAEAVGVAALVAGSGIAGPLVAAVLLGATFVPITAFGLVAARALARGRERQVAALMTSCFSLGSIVAPPLAGLTHDITGSFALPTYVAAGALALAALVSQLALRPDPRRPYPDGLPA